MTHRIRVFVSMAILLGVVVFGAWAVMLTTTIRPFADRLEDEHVALALGAARIVEETPSDERAAIREASKRLGVKVTILDELPSRRTDRATETRRDGHTVYSWARPNAPTIVSLNLPGRTRYLSMKFEEGDEISTIGRRAAAGLVLIAALALAGAFVATRWVLRPLEVADTAMLRVAAGDLQHRVPEGQDVAGRMGKTFNQMAERVEAMVEGQKQLLAAVSHELRTPLTRMRLVVEMLQDQGVDRRHLSSMETDIDEVDRLVATLLESTRLDRGGWVLEKAPTSLASVLSRAADGLELGSRRLEVDAGEGLSLQADASRLDRVFKNLFTNFVRYTPESATCWVRATQDARGTQVVVEDDGPGVPAASIERLFTPFYRVDPSRSRQTGGLGLGLMLVRQIVEAHGGTIVAEPRPGGGLRFLIALPPG
jgi:signal transduction histidine kinase